MTSESVALLNKYLSYASNASFNKFVHKEKDQIIKISKDLDCNTPLHLMNYWVNCYNQTTSSRRSTAKIQAIPKKEASITFKKIFDTAAALDKSSQRYKNNAILTLCDYANLARETLKPITHDRSSYNEPSSSGISSIDNINSNYDKKGKGISISSVDSNYIEDELLRRLNERILHNKVLPKLDISVTNKTITAALLRKAAEMISAENLDSEQLEFVKLCVSKSINLLNHHYVELYKQILKYDAYNEIAQSAIDIKSKLVVTEYQFVTDLFTKLRQFQFDRTCQSSLVLLDNLKAAEADKCSEYYKLLRIVNCMVSNFKV